MHLSETEYKQLWSHLSHNNPLQVVEQMLTDSTHQLDAYRHDYQLTGDPQTRRKIDEIQQRVETLTEVFVHLMEFYASKN
jgi:hypothetical protein